VIGFAAWRLSGGGAPGLRDPAAPRIQVGDAQILAGEAGAPAAAARTNLTLVPDVAVLAQRGGRAQNYSSTQKRGATCEEVRT